MQKRVPRPLESLDRISLDDVAFDDLERCVQDEPEPRRSPMIRTTGDVEPAEG